MNAFIKHFKWVMVVAGVLTTTMLYAAIAPDASLTANFGETIDGPLAEIVGDELLPRRAIPSVVRTLTTRALP